MAGANASATTTNENLDCMFQTLSDDFHIKPISFVETEGWIKIMNLTAILLVITSACMHAGWNFFSKKQSPSIVFFLLASLGTIVWFSPVLVWGAELISSMDSTLWIILWTAGLFQAVYYAGLAGAYMHGAFSIAYPLARTLALLFVVMLTFVTGRGTELSFYALTGILAIMVGAIILPMNSFRDFRLLNYLNPSCLFAVMAAAGTAGYSFIDDIGMENINSLSADMPELGRALVYLQLECITTVAWLSLFQLYTTKKKKSCGTNWRSMIRPAFFTGLAIGATYGIVLLAMSYSVNVSYVVALRQLSIPIGALLGIFLLREFAPLTRYLGVGILFIGLILVAVG